MVEGRPYWITGRVMTSEVVEKESLEHSFEEGVI